MPEADQTRTPGANRFENPDLGTWCVRLRRTYSTVSGSHHQGGNDIDSARIAEPIAAGRCTNRKTCSGPSPYPGRRHEAVRVKVPLGVGRKQWTRQKGVGLDPEQHVTVRHSSTRVALFRNVLRSKRSCENRVATCCRGSFGVRYRQQPDTPSDAFYKAGAANRRRRNPHSFTS
jgi:hypothetical protein